MPRSVLIGLVAVGFMAGGSFAQDKMDCGKAYKGLWDKVEREKYTRISPGQLAGISRLALHAYDACQAGDEQDAKHIFEKVAALVSRLGDSGPGPYNPNQPSR